MIINLFLIVFFAIALNWMVNLQILANVEKTKRDKILAMAGSFALAIVLGVLVFI